MKKLFKIIRISVFVCGVLFISFVILSFTDIPFYAYHRLGSEGTAPDSPPELIVVLGGAGMPSPDGLMRSFHGAAAAQIYKHAQIILALPLNKNSTDSLHQLRLMERELLLRGIDSSRIRYEPYGFNTRSQAMNISSMFAEVRSKPSLLLITSPEHMYRAVHTFRKAGFSKISGSAAFEKPSDPEMVRDRGASHDLRVKNLDLRYNMWSYLNYELLVMREYIAICYYKLKGWI